MKATKKVRIAVVGLGFGREFIRMYRSHPDVAYVGICDTNEALLYDVGESLGFARRHKRFEDVVASSEYDAVHILTPFPGHADQAIAVMESGKHCACAVTMGSTLDELRAVIEIQRETKMNYMMMETAVYTREFLYAKDLLDNGTLGKIQFLRGAHYDDLENLPNYWIGLPPMHYVTHAVGPVLALAGTRATRVSCFGSGRMPEAYVKNYSNPYPIETAIFQMEGSDVAFEITRSTIETAVHWKETFDIFGDKATFQWPQHLDQKPTLITLHPAERGARRRSTVTRIDLPAYPERVPKELAEFASEGYNTSHAHLVHEFVRSIMEERTPAIDAVTAANWCAPGICAHESALRRGELVEIPDFV